MKSATTILLIEDDADDQEFFIDAIGHIQNAALYFVAKNGIEAIEKLNSTAILPDVIFSDINMPLMDGFECLTRIRMSEHTKNIPVIFLTTDLRRELALKMGAYAFIKKPAAGNLLSNLIDQAINPDLNAGLHQIIAASKKSTVPVCLLCR